jgi:hypothetical protein
MQKTMSFAPKEPPRLAWLASQLSEQRAALSQLIRSLKGFGPRANMKPSHFRKFVLLLNQVAFEKEKEAELICRIEAVEQKHRFARKHPMLRKRAERRLRLMPQPCMDQPKAKRPGLEWIWIFVLWRIFSGRHIAHK